MRKDKLPESLEVDGTARDVPFWAILLIAFQPPKK